MFVKLISFSTYKSAFPRLFGYKALVVPAIIIGSPELKAKL